MVSAREVGSVQVLGDNEWLDQKAIDGLVRGGVERECREIDLLIPEREQVKVGVQRVNKGLVRRDASLPRPLPQSFVELAWSHRPTG